MSAAAQRLKVAWIDEPDCIGCALCLKVCPTDAILGAPKQMHTIIAADCTGCEKCLPACPTDCISMRPRAPEPLRPAELAARWRKRYRARNARLTGERQAEAQARQRQREALRKP